MNNLDLLRAAVVAHPEEEAPAAMFLDELAEQTGRDPAACRAELDELTRPYRDQKAMTAAAGYLAEGAPLREAIHEVIRSVLNLPADAALFVVLVPGEQVLLYTQPPRPRRHGVYAVRAITVGANRLLRIAKAIEQDPNAHSPIPYRLTPETSFPV